MKDRVCPRVLEVDVTDMVRILGTVGTNLTVREKEVLLNAWICKLCDFYGMNAENSIIKRSEDEKLDEIEKPLRKKQMEETERKYKKGYRIDRVTEEEIIIDRRIGRRVERLKSIILNYNSHDTGHSIMKDFIRACSITNDNYWAMSIVRKMGVDAGYLEDSKQGACVMNGYIRN